MPKGRPTARGERHLAVHVEDHPLEYGDFEGTIPAGEYGAGTVEIWDRGTYELLEEKRDGGLTVRLHGERLDGVWTLVPAHLDGDRRTGSSCARTRARGSATRTSRCSPLDRHAARRARLGLRAEVGRVPRDRDRVRRRRVVQEPKRQRPHQRFRDVARAAALAIRSSDAVLDGEICARSTRPVARGSRSSRRRRHRRARGLRPPRGRVRAARRPAARRAEEATRAARRPAPGVLVSPQFDDGRRSSSPRASRSSRASWPS